MVERAGRSDKVRGTPVRDTRRSPVNPYDIRDWNLIKYNQVSFDLPLDAGTQRPVNAYATRAK